MDSVALRRSCSGVEPVVENVPGSRESATLAIAQGMGTAGLFGMWNRAFLALAGACFLYGCSPAPGHDYEIVIDPRVSAEDVSSITSATYQWAAILDGHLKVGTMIHSCTGA